MFFRILFIIIISIVLFFPAWYLIKFLYKKINLIDDDIIIEHEKLKNKEKQIKKNIKEKINENEKEHQKLTKIEKEL